MINVRETVDDLYERNFLCNKARGIGVPEEYLKNDMLHKLFQLYLEHTIKIKQSDFHPQTIDSLLEIPIEEMCSKWNIKPKQWKELYNQYTECLGDQVRQIERWYENGYNR